MKQIYLLFVLCAALLLSQNEVQAQDPHFSQYYASPLTLNPAMTGVFNGNYRISGIYRNQWHSILKSDDPAGTPAFNTFSGAFDLRFDVNKHDGIGVGLTFLTDKAGPASYSSNQLALSFAYSKALGQLFNHNISLGFSAGGTIRGINYSNLRFGDQFDGTGFNGGLPSGETGINTSFMFFNVGAGILYYYVNKNSFNKGRTNFYIGFSADHLNQPNQSFYSGANAKLYIKYSVSGGAGFPAGTFVDIQPNFLFMLQGPSIETDLGSFVKIFFEQGKPYGNAFYIGPWYRIVGQDGGGIASESLVLSTKIDYSSFTFGFSFDLNLSKLTAATNTNGAFEISLAHVGSWAKKPKIFFCPRF